ncbi:PREDICTED: DENN domain and WD repeat-containing SCD1 [Prunus dulcis]|uniref:PREDICTED: DENN domain and WD repeat-containing SCD1 n=1 Tax=Prunus dulcis TaxID=3755 RepID=A0A5E4F5X2_PRUDU|nr:PREDICTED: DENN domain and WD repeat-containing SCD1 [Prunus dulcis]
MLWGAIDQMKDGLYSLPEQYPEGVNKPWGEGHDLQPRLVFLKFFASLLSGYRNFIEVSAAHVFYTQAFLTMRPRSIGQPPEPMLTQFLHSHGFHGLSGKRNGF